MIFRYLPLLALLALAAVIAIAPGADAQINAAGPAPAELQAAMEKARTEAREAAERGKALEADALAATEAADKTAREAAALAARIQQSEAEIAEAYRMAISLARSQLNFNPQDLETRAYLAFYLAATGDESQALDEIAQIRRIQTKNVLALRLCIRAYERMHMRGNALEMLAIYIDFGGSLDTIIKNPDFLDMQEDIKYKELIQNQQK